MLPAAARAKPSFKPYKSFRLRVLSKYRNKSASNKELLPLMRVKPTYFDSESLYHSAQPGLDGKSNNIFEASQWLVKALMGLGLIIGCR